VRDLIGDSAFEFENSQVVWSVLMDYQNAKPIRGNIFGFTNVLVTHKVHYAANITGLELDDFYRFEKALE